MRTAFLRWILTGLSAVGAAGAEVWDLPALLEHAKKHAPEIAEARALVGKARGQRGEARAGRTPQMEVMTAFGAVPRARGDATFSPDSDTIGDFSLSNLGPFVRTEFTLTWPLYTFGRISSYNRAADKGLEAANAEADKKEAEVLFEIKKLYHEHQMALAMSDLVSEMTDRLEDALKKGEKLLKRKSGKISKKDILRLKVFLYELRRAELEAKNGVELSRAALAQKAGIAENDGFRVKRERLRPPEWTLEPLETYEKKMWENRPEWRQLQAGLEARKAQIAALDRESWPVLALVGTVRHAYAPNRDDQKNPFVLDEFNLFQGGVFGALRWNMNFFSNAAKKAQTKAEYDALVEKERFAKTGLALELRKTYRDAQSAWKRVEFATEGMKAARGWLFSAGLNYGVGVAGAEELLAAMAAWGQARRSYIEAIRDLNVGIAKLSQVVGEEIRPSP